MIGNKDATSSLERGDSVPRVYRRSLNKSMTKVYKSIYCTKGEDVNVHPIPGNWCGKTWKCIKPKNGKSFKVSCI